MKTLLTLFLLFSMNTVGQTIPFRFYTTLNDSVTIEIYEYTLLIDSVTRQEEGKDFILRNDLLVYLYTEELLILFESNKNYYVSFFGITSNFRKSMYVYCEKPPIPHSSIPLTWEIDFNNSLHLSIKYNPILKHYHYHYYEAQTITR